VFGNHVTTNTKVNNVKLYSKVAKIKFVAVFGIKRVFVICHVIV